MVVALARESQKLFEMERRGPARSEKNAERHPQRETAGLNPSGPAHQRPSEQRSDREQLTVQLPTDVVDQLRDAVYWTPGLTITGFVSQCITSVVKRLETERGDRFPKRERALRPGRPKKKS